MRRVLFSTTAGAGHFGPLVPFAEACRGSGFDVMVAAPASFRSTVEGAGFDFAPLGERTDAAAGAMFARIAGADFDEANRIMLADGFADLYPRAALSTMRRLVDDWQPDIIVRETAEMASLVVAAAQRISHVQVAIGLLDLISMFGSIGSSGLQTIAQDNGLAIPSDDALFDDEPILSLTPPSFDDPETRPIARFSAPPAAVEPDRTLVGDGPLVYLTFGSEAGAMPGIYPDLCRATIGALAGHGWRLIVTVGRAADPDALGQLPPRVRVERWLPQDVVLRHADVVVCHGGYGTVLGALRTGVPVVAMPIFSVDQRANAARITDRGLGGSIGGPHELGNLASTVSGVLGDSRSRPNARAIAAEIRGLRPMSDAADVIGGLRT